MYKPKITIITPSYNQGQFLEKTIKSVIDQNYPNLEYIIIDGGSTDNSINIIKKYKKYLSYWVSEKDNGQSNAINKGLIRATGEIIAWLNSDDVYVEDTLRLISNYFETYPEADLVYGNSVIIDNDDRLLKHRKEIGFDKSMGKCIGFGVLIPQPSAFWRRSIHDQIGYLNEELNYNMDGDFWGRVAEKYKVVHVNKTLSKARFHIGAKTVKFIDKHDECALREIQNHIEYHYNQTKISKLIPFNKSKTIRKIYRLKRILIRFLYGHYFLKYSTSTSLIKNNLK